MRIAIIGAGPAGIAAGRELLRQGFSEFTIFDALDAAGGTWRLHSYPGLACDVWAHSYSFSYAPNPDWSASFVGFAEIQAYLAGCATRFGLDEHMQFNTRITAARYREPGCWALESTSGPLGEFDILINAMGNQHTPLFPDVEGRDSFNGDSWHATRWNHDVDLKGKRVVVVGSAASAVQIVPEIAEDTGHLTQPFGRGSLNRTFPSEASHMLLLKSFTAEGSAYQEIRLSIRDHSDSVSGSSLTATTRSETSTSLS